MEDVFPAEGIYRVVDFEDAARGERLAAPVVLEEHRVLDAVRDVPLAAEHFGY